MYAYILKKQAGLVKPIQGLRNRILNILKAWMHFDQKKRGSSSGEGVLRAQIFLETSLYF
jgi:hypothetical protein